MVKCIHFIKYKKLKNIDISFDKGVNVIAGTNGTCKTSLLHVISNSYQGMRKNDPRLKSPKCLSIINGTNYMMNAKIERLNKGAKGCTDHAPGLKGALYKVGFFDNTELQFRRHNSASSDRYSMKPLYNRKGQSLPMLPVIYLGIKRLFPLGEYSDDSVIRTRNVDLPQQYLHELKEAYQKFTGIDMINISSEAMDGVKVRPGFFTSDKGIDSNTISVGEDNLYIILHSLYSLKYYYDNIEPSREVESILLIDELDASLHPFLQIALIDMFEEFSKRYRIQIVFTTHSLTAIDQALRKKMKVNYLIDYGEWVHLIDHPDSISIEAFLKNKMKRDLFRKKKITVWMEDDEARTLFRILLDNRPNEAYEYFDTLDVNIGCDQLASIFKDPKVHSNMVGCICILDGDQSSKCNLDEKIMCLPGKSAPDRIAIKYGLELYESGKKDFWEQEELINDGIDRTYYRTNINKGAKKTLKCKRDTVKNHYQQNAVFYRMVLKQWVLDMSESHDPTIDKFYEDLKIMFMKNTLPLLLPQNKWSLREKVEHDDKLFQSDY